MTTPNNVWEIHDGWFVDVACAKCAHEFLVERGISNHEIGQDYNNEESGIAIFEDVYGQHSENDHKCACGIALG